MPRAGDPEGGRRGDHDGDHDDLGQHRPEGGVEALRAYGPGELDVMTALARGEITARGSISKAQRLLPLMPPLYEEYRNVREAPAPGDSA